MAARRRLVAVDPDRSLADVVRDAAGAMPWLQDSDRAMVELAVRYAQTIEDAPDHEMAKTLGWMGPHLANALKALGGSPAERAALGVEEAVRGRLAELRSASRVRNAKVVDPSA